MESYGDYVGEGRKLTDTEEILPIFSNCYETALKEFVRFNRECTEETFLDIGEDKEIDQSNVAGYINRYLGEKGLGLNDLRSIAYKSVREELITLLLERSTFP